VFAANGGKREQPITWEDGRTEVREFTCTHRKYHRYEKLEPAILGRIGQFVVEDRVEVDPSVAALELAMNRKAHVDAEGDKLAADKDLMDNKFMKARLKVLAEESERLEGEIAALRKAVQSVQTRIPAKTHQEALQRLAADMSSKSGSELYALRASINEALKGIVDCIEFDPNGDARVIMLGGLRAYRFRDGEFIDEWDGTNLVTAEPSRPLDLYWIERDGTRNRLATPQPHPLDVYTGGDPAKEALFRKIKA
jgi:hypothetical protein